MKVRRKLIEVSLPLEKINAAAAREKSIRHGHPSTLHLWWARRPLAAARAVIFAQLVDDPSEYIDDSAAAEQERQRLHLLIEQLVLWENTTNELIIESAREEIRKSWCRTCADNADDPRAKELFDPEKLPAFHDPFAGGGALPLEAQRLGLQAYASDLNPVAVLINKAMIEIPPKFARRPPVNPDAKLKGGSWKGAHGLANDVRHYGTWMREEAERRIGHLYPRVEITAAMAHDRPDLKPYVGRSLPIIAWLWARTVASPNPAFAAVQVPLASTFMLSTKPGREVYVLPIVEAGGYRFTVKLGQPENPEQARNGTKLARANFTCLMSGTPIPGPHIKAEAMAGRMGARLMAMVVEGDRGRLYLPPTIEQEEVARRATPDWRPDLTISGSTQYLGVKPYGMERFDQLFTNRQLVALNTLSDLVSEAKERVIRDAVGAGLSDDRRQLHSGGNGATAYGEAVAIYLAFAISKIANIGSSAASWMSDRGAFRETFARQAIPMTWDYAEANPFADAGGSLSTALTKSGMVIDWLVSDVPGVSAMADATSQEITRGKVVSTDPPYYDNVPYADLSDFFYVWLRRSLRSVLPELFATVAVPKQEELVAFAYRHGGKAGAEQFFLEGMTRAMQRLSEQSHPAFPLSIYYAFKQAESIDTEGGIRNTGWETFLDAVVKAGLATTGTWPVRTEGAGRIRALDSNALASSIVLVCRHRDVAQAAVTRREFVSALKAELPAAVAHLQASNIAPVDLAQAAIGPGMAVFTRYTKVLDAEGKALGVREALALINRTLDEALAEQEGDFDADSRWALAWFEQFGFAEGDYGVAEQLSKSKATSVDGMVKAGIVSAAHGRVQLLRPSQLDPAWDPATDRRRPAWQAVHQLVRASDEGEIALAGLVRKLGPEAETARELAYRLYAICEKKKRTTEALWYNGLVQSWAEAQRLAVDGRRAEQSSLFAEA